MAYWLPRSEWAPDPSPGGRRASAISRISTTSRLSVVADMLVLSTLNSAIGLHSPTGRWVTFNTPVDGVRRASAHEIVFQARSEIPEQNCCGANAARGLGLVSECALMRDAEGTVLN